MEGDLDGEDDGEAVLFVGDLLGLLEVRLVAVKVKMMER